MFYIIDDLQRTVVLHPKYSTQSREELKKLVTFKGYGEIEGTFDPAHGHIVVLLKFNYIGEEIIINDKGMLEFKVSAKVVAQMPCIGEIVDAVVTDIKLQSIMTKFCGIIPCTIKSDDFAEDEYVYMKMDKEQEEGSKKSTAYFLHPSNPSKNITVGSCVRVKILHRLIGKNAFFLVATMNDGHNRHLGILENMPKFGVDVNLNDQIENSSKDDDEILTPSQDNVGNSTTVEEKDEVVQSDLQETIEGDFTISRTTDGICDKNGVILGGKDVALLSQQAIEESNDSDSDSDGMMYMYPISF